MSKPTTLSVTHNTNNSQPQYINHMERLQLSLSLAEKEAQAFHKEAEIIRIKIKMLENKGYSSESPPTPQTPSPVFPKPLPEESLPIPPEESKKFSEDGMEAVKEMMEQLKGKYNIKSHTHKGTKDAYFKISKEWWENAVIIENYDQGARNDFGLITTPKISQQHYSDEGRSIIKKWDGFGRTIQRKQYNFKGKNIVQTLSIIDKLLS